MTKRSTEGSTWSIRRGRIGFGVREVVHIDLFKYFVYQPPFPVQKQVGPSLWADIDQKGEEALHCDAAGVEPYVCAPVTVFVINRGNT